MKTVSLKLPAEVDAQLESRARRTGRSKSALTREALERFLQGDGDCQASCLDLARDLIGIAEGPAGLSTGKRHFRGYGR